MLTYANLTGLNVIATQCAIVELWLTRGQSKILGVDKATTIDADAIRIGNDEVGFLTCDFLPPQNLTGVVAINLVDNGAGRGIAQLWIAADITAQLSLRHLSAVIEDQTDGRDIVVFELIKRNALAVGRHNLNHGHTIACGRDHGLVTRSSAVRCNRNWIGQQWLPNLKRD